MFRAVKPVRSASPRREREAPSARTASVRCPVVLASCFITVLQRALSRIRSAPLRACPVRPAPIPPATQRACACLAILASIRAPEPLSAPRHALSDSVTASCSLRGCGGVSVPRWQLHESVRQQHVRSLRKGSAPNPFTFWFAHQVVSPVLDAGSYSDIDGSQACQPCQQGRYSARLGASV